MPDGLVQTVDDGPVRVANVIHIAVEVENPAKRLWRRADVVALGGEDDDRRGDVADIEHRAVMRFQRVAGQLVADEQVVDQELQLVAIKLDEVAPPFLEGKVAFGVAVDMDEDLVLLAPEPVRRVQHVEVQDQPGAVELAMAEVAGQRGQPAAAQQSARIAHRILAALALPVGHRRADHEAGPEEVGPQHRHHQRLIARLTVADREWARRIGVQRHHALEERHLPLDDIEECLAGRRGRAEAEEIDRVALGQGVADLAVGLEAADTGTLAGARVDHHHGAFAGIGRGAVRRQDAQEGIVDRPRQGEAVHHHLVAIAQHGGERPRSDLDFFVAALAQEVEEEQAALEGVDQVVGQRLQSSPGGEARMGSGGSVTPGFARNLLDLHVEFPCEACGANAPPRSRPRTDVDHAARGCEGSPTASGCTARIAHRGRRPLPFRALPGHLSSVPMRGSAPRCRCSRPEVDGQTSRPDRPA